MRTYTPKMAKQCARNGAALLDATDPLWARHIDLSALKMESGCNCTLGQLYGRVYATQETSLFGVVSLYSAILHDKFGAPQWQAVVGKLATEQPTLYELLYSSEEDQWPDKFLGFDVPFWDDDHEETHANMQRRIVNEYTMLQHAWIAEIEKRLD